MENKQPRDEHRSLRTRGRILPSAWPSTDHALLLSSNHALPHDLPRFRGFLHGNLVPKHEAFQTPKPKRPKHGSPLGCDPSIRPSRHRTARLFHLPTSHPSAPNQRQISQDTERQRCRRVNQHQVTPIKPFPVNTHPPARLCSAGRDGLGLSKGFLACTGFSGTLTVSVGL